VKRSRAGNRRQASRSALALRREALARVVLTLPLPALRVVSGIPADGLPSAPGGPSRAWLHGWFCDCPPARTKSGAGRSPSRIMGPSGAARVSRKPNANIAS
jgi:hypothetical protein